MSGTSKSVGGSTSPCLICGEQTGLKTEGVAGDDSHLCRECWDDRLDEDRVLIELAERGILPPESTAVVFEAFYDNTVKTDHQPPEFDGSLSGVAMTTAVRRGQPTTLAQLAGVAGCNDGWSPYNGVWWDVENGDTSVFAVAVIYSLESDFPTVGATLYVGETIEVLWRLLDEHPYGASPGGV